MKAKLIEVKEKIKFKPFKVEITIENIEDLQYITDSFNSGFLIGKSDIWNMFNDKLKELK